MHITWMIIRVFFIVFHPSFWKVPGVFQEMQLCMLINWWLIITIYLSREVKMIQLQQQGGWNPSKLTKILLWWSYYFNTVVTCLFLVQGLELRWQICRVYGTKILNHHGSMFSVPPSPFIISIALYVVHYLSHRS